MSCCDKPKVFERKNGKVLHEFNCSNCSGYITVKLDEDLDGAHCIVCPSCKHEHYRIIKEGVITEDRAPDRAKSYAIRICPTIAAYSKTSWESKMANRKSNVKDEGKHFLNDAWKKMTGSQKQHPPQSEEVVEVKKVEKSKCTPKVTCIGCFTELIDAPGIGPYCPNPKCDRVDDQRVDRPKDLTEDEIKELIDRMKTKKEVAIKIQDFVAASKFREEERIQRDILDLRRKKDADPKDIKVDAEEVSIIDELLSLCATRKKVKVGMEEYHSAHKWKNIEDRLKHMKGELVK